MNTRRILWGIAALTLALCLCAAGHAQSEYRTLEQGDSGEDVLLLKERMYALGYFASLKLSDQYNGVTVERVKLLQKANGLEQTGVATPDLQAFIYSDQCLWQSPTPAPTPAPTPTPAPKGPTAEIPLPALNGEGFLADAAAEPFVHIDAEDGRWLYVSADIQVDIKRYESEPMKLVWFETFIKLTDNTRLTSFLSAGKKPGANMVMPTQIAKDNQAIVAFSDDFFGYRPAYNIVPGVIVRDRAILYEKTRKPDSKIWPPLDVIALFEDGSLKTFVSSEHTAQEYLDMGVIDTYAFGPIFVRDGQLCEDIYNWSDSDKDPRVVLGMIAPREYCVLTVTGRRSDSVGATIQWTARKIKEMGAVEALNLDGGNTACLIFMDKIINRTEYVKPSSIRRVTGMIGVSEAR